MAHSTTGLRKVRMSFSRYRNVILLSTGQGISQLGSSLTNIAFIYWIKQHYESGTVLGMFFLAATFSAAAISLIAGSLIDRWPRTRFLGCTDLIAGAVMGLLILAFRTDLPSAGMLTVVMASKVSLSLLYGLRQPAIGAAIGEVTATAELAAANSVFSASRQFAIVTSEAVSGVAYGVLGLSLIFSVDMLTYLAAAILMFAIPLKRRNPGPRPNEPHAGFWAETVSGWRLMRMESGLAPLAMSVMVINFFFAPYVVWTPFLIENQRGLSTQWFGYVTAAMSFGILAGSNANWLRWFRDNDSTVYFGTLFGLAVVFSALVLPLPAGGLLCVFFVLGTFTGAFNVKIMGVVQMRTPKEFHGRIFSIIFGIGFLLGPLGKVIGGFVLDLINKRADLLFGFSGIGMGLATLLLVRTPSLKKLLN